MPGTHSTGLLGLCFGRSESRCQQRVLPEWSISNFYFLISTKKTCLFLEAENILHPLFCGVFVPLCPFFGVPVAPLLHWV